MSHSERIQEAAKEPLEEIRRIASGENELGEGKDAEDALRVIDDICKDALKVSGHKDLNWLILASVKFNGSSHEVNWENAEKLIAAIISKHIPEQNDLREALDGLTQAADVMVREWCEEMGDEAHNGTPGDVLEKLREAIRRARSLATPSEPLEGAKEKK